MNSLWAMMRVNLTKNRQKVRCRGKFSVLKVENEFFIKYERYLSHFNVESTRDGDEMKTFEETSKTASLQYFLII